MGFRYVARSLGRLFFPECCAVCHRGLSEGEQYICLDCFAGMPRVRDMGDVGALFAGCRDVEAAVSCFSYGRHSRYTGILKDLKYRNHPQIGSYLASVFSKEFMQQGFFAGVDMIVPVPLHKDKLIIRGYNQSRFIAEGISSVCGVPVVEAIKAVSPHGSQTSRSIEERRRNVAGVFDVVGEVAGKKVLLVDDVITTGATLSSCCDCLSQAGVSGVKIFSLSIAENSL